ncbi:MAG: hypothetical protein ACR2GY_00250 [Phycisphaerales bacterium]
MLRTLSIRSGFLRYAFKRAGVPVERLDASVEYAIAQLELKHGEFISVQMYKARANGEEYVEPTANAKGHLPQMGTRPLDVTSNLYAIIDAAFREAGFEEHANQLTKNALDVMDFRNKDSHRHRTQDWKQIPRHHLVAEAFATVEPDAEVALQMAIFALESLNMPGYIAPTSEQCPGYRAKIIWCDENRQQESSIVYIKRNAWDSLVAACPTSGICPMGEEHWYTLTLSDADCLDGMPGPGTCVWFRVLGSLEDLDCEGMLTLACFEETDETSAINCSLIEIVCGPSTSGPTGCPDCDP